MNLIIDIGNSVAKIAIFDKEKLVEVFRGSNHSLDCLPMFCHKYSIQKGVIASVITLSNTIRKQLEALPFPVIELSYQTPVPITNLYESPQTLGMDRLAAAVAANYLKPGHDVLVIDAGTCIIRFHRQRRELPRWEHIPRHANEVQSAQYLYRQIAESLSKRRKTDVWPNDRNRHPFGCNSRH